MRSELMVTSEGPCVRTSAATTSARDRRPASTPASRSRFVRWTVNAATAISTRAIPGTNSSVSRNLSGARRQAVITNLVSHTANRLDGVAPERFVDLLSEIPDVHVDNVGVVVVREVPQVL